MSNEKVVADHYTRGGLLEAIETSLLEMGKTVDNVTVDDLAPVDEFHIGGRGATEHFMHQLNFAPDDQLLDIGCGIGGASRFVASRYNSIVTGIDLTSEYIETGNVLCRWVGLDEQVMLYQSSALTLPFENETFDGGFMIHVGMNIADKSQLFKEIYRVLRPRATFGVYDIMRIGAGEVSYPVPWASEPSTCNLAVLPFYRQALQEAEFTILSENVRHQFAIDFFKAVRANNEANGGPPPLGLHTLVGESTAVKFKNMVQSIEDGYIAPVEIIAQK